MRYNSSFPGKGQGPQLWQGVDVILSLLSLSLRFRFKLCRKRTQTNEVLCLKCCMVQSSQDHYKRICMYQTLVFDLKILERIMACHWQDHD